MEGFRWIHKVEEYSAQKSYHIFQLAIFFLSIGKMISSDLGGSEYLDFSLLIT